MPCENIKVSWENQQLNTWETMLVFLTSTLRNSKPWETLFKGWECWEFSQPFSRFSTFSSSVLRAVIGHAYSPPRITTSIINSRSKDWLDYRGGLLTALFLSKPSFRITSRDYYWSCTELNLMDLGTRKTQFSRSSKTVSDCPILLKLFLWATKICFWKIYNSSGKLKAVNC